MVCVWCLELMVFNSVIGSTCLIVGLTTHEMSLASIFFPSKVVWSKSVQNYLC